VISALPRRAPLYESRVVRTEHRRATSTSQRLVVPYATHGTSQYRRFSSDQFHLLRDREIRTQCGDRFHQPARAQLPGGRMVTMALAAMQLVNVVGIGAQPPAVGSAPGTSRRPRPVCRAFQCLSQIARTSFIVRRSVGVPTRNAVYGPVCTVVGQGRRATAAPTPIKRIYGQFAVHVPPTWNPVSALGV
jgi:hypothetical protein